MKDNKDRISFVANATTKEALVYSFLYAGVFFRNTWRAVNKFAHRFPWMLVGLVFFACTITSYVCIGRARAERDHYNKENYQLTQELSKYKAAVEYRK